MSSQQPFASAGDEGESEAVHEPFRDAEPPTRSKAQPAVWLVSIGIMLLLLLGFLVAWGVGMLDVG